MTESLADHRVRVFERSYSEVLLFLKHEDDKINRVLTALAFLTAAGVALYISSGSRVGEDSPRFAHSHLHADAFFFAAFILGVALSVALALAALDPTSFTPRFLDYKGDPNDSLLFYGAIAEQTREDWGELLHDAGIQARYAGSLHSDAHRLARRARHKVQRFMLANAFVQFTVVALALLGAVRLTPHVTEHTRWIVVSAVLIAYVLMPVLDFAYFWWSNFPGVRAPGPDPRAFRRVLEWGAYTLPVVGVSLAGVVTNFGGWQPVVFGLFATVFLRVLSAFKIPWRTPLISVVLSCAGVFAGGLWLWVL